MKKVIVSGACGFIGQAVSRALIKQGVEVYGLSLQLDRLGDLKDNPKFHIIVAEFKDYKKLPEMVGETDFDAFFHFAWQGYGKSTNDYQVQIPNVEYACDAAYAALALKCKRFIFADSSHEHLKSKTADGSESICSIYGSAKNAASRLCRVIMHNGGGEFVGVLFTNIFGVGDWSNRSTNAMLRRLMNGQDLDLIDGKNLYDWTYIDDCVGGVIAAAEAGVNNKVYYVGSRVLRPFSEIITEVRDIVAPDAKLNFGAYNDPTYIDYEEIDTYALYRDTGYLPSADFKEGVIATVKWLKTIQ